MKKKDKIFHLWAITPIRSDSFHLYKQIFVKLNGCILSLCSGFSHVGYLGCQRGHRTLFKTQ